MTAALNDYNQTDMVIYGKVFAKRGVMQKNNIKNAFQHYIRALKMDTMKTPQAVFAFLMVLLMPVVGFGQTTLTVVPSAANTGASGTSYITTATAFTNQSINWSINNWIPNTIQVRGNQTSAASNFQFSNTSAMAGSISKVTVTRNAGTLDATKIFLLVGTSAQSGTSGGTAGTMNGNNVEWTVGGSNTFFQIYFTNGATSGTTTITNIIIQYSSGTNYYWNGSNTSNLTTGNNWDNNSSKNWSQPTATTFTSGNGVVWPTTGSSLIANFNNANATTVNIPAALTQAPSSTVVGTSGYSFVPSATQTFSSPVTLSQSLTIAPATGTTFTMSGVLGSTGGLTQNGAGTTILSGTNTYSGTTTISAGTLSVAANANTGSGNITMNGGTLAVTTGFSTNKNFTLSNANTLNVSSGQTLTLGSSATTGQLNGGSSTTLTLSGAGTVVLNANNQNYYSGKYILNNGVLTAGSTGWFSAQPTNPLVSGFPFTINGGTLDYTGFTTDNVYYSYLLGTSTSGGINMTSGTMAVLGVCSDLTSGGVLNKLGAGTVSLSGANTYTGATNVNAGILQLGANGTLPSATDVTVATATTLNVNGKTQTIGSLAGAGAVTLGAGALTVNGTNSTTYSGVVSGTGSLTKNGTSTLTLSGANTYSGATTIIGGELRLNPSANLSASGTCDFKGGQLATTGITSGRTVTFNSIALSETSTLDLAAATSHSITFTNVGTFASGKTLIIKNWAGTPGDGSTGTQGKVFIGSSNTSLTCSLLGQIKFLIGATTYDAALRSNGEVVPANVTTPTISSLSPATATTGGSSFTLTVNGANFINGLSTITWGGSIRTTTFVNSGQLTCTISAGDIASSGTVAVGVTTVCTSSATSNFVISAPTNTITTSGLSSFSICNSSNSSSFNVAFTISGSFSNYYVQLSNASGVFPTDATSNYISSLATSSPISATIPAGQAAGTGYRVRVVSTSPTYYTSGDNGSNITVTAAPSTANAGNLQSICNATTATLAATNPSIGTGVWTASAISGSGTVNTPSSNTSAVTGLAVGDNIFKWTTSNGVCADSVATVTIHIDAAATVSSPGSTQILCNAATTGTLAGNNPSVGTGAWSLVSGSGSVTTPSQYNSGITGLGTGNNVFKWTITNGACSSNNNVTITVNPVTTFSPSSPQLCTNGTVAVTSSAAGTFSSILPSGVTIPGSATSWTITGNGAAVGSGSATFTTTSGSCTNSLSYTLNDIPGATTASGAGTFCGSTTITASGGTGGTIYYQGTTSGGTSTATASSSQSVSASGTYYFRAKNANGCWGAEGSVAVTVNGKPGFVSPGNQSASVPSPATFSVTSVTGTVSGYQWQLSTDNGSNWADVTTGSGGTTASYTTPATATGMNGYQYRCIVKGTTPCVDSTSAAATLTVTITPTVLYLHNFNTGATASPYNVSPTATTGTPTGVLNSNLSNSSWVSSNSAFTNFGGNSGTALVIQPSNGTTSSLTLTFDVASGSQCTITSFDFWRQRSASGPTSISSITINGITIGSSISVPSSGSFIGSTNVANSVANLTGTVTVVINLSAPSSTSQNFRLDEFTLYGYISASCTPAADPSGTISGTASACDNSSLSFSGTAPSGDVYYWQNSSTGKSTSLGDAANSLAVTTSGNYYVQAYKTSTSCWSDNLVGPYAVTITSGTTSVTPTTTQDIQTSTNSLNPLTVSVGSTITSKRWMYSTTSGSGYTAFSPAQTGTTYTPNFSTANTYYVVCEVTYPSPCGVVYSNEVRINVTNPGPPVITHTALTSMTSTVAQTATATITSSTSLTCTPFITYRINGGSWTTVNGTNTSGSTYTFSIPGQVASTLVEYFLTACNSAGTVTSPSNVTTSSSYGSFNEYTINCAAASSGTQTIAYQSFEFAGSSSYTFSVDNTNTSPTGAQNYPAHASAVEWNYYNKGANGSSSVTNRNACGCMADTYSGLPASCPDNGNPVYSAGGSTGFCRTYSGNSRGVYVNTSASTENPTGSRSRNGSYSYIQQSRQDGGVSPMSFIYFNDVAIPDASNATNIKVIAYVSSISTGSLSNGSESSDFVELDVKYNSSNTANTMVSDPTCGSDLYFFSSTAGSSVSGSTNSRWDFSGNTWSTAPAVSGTTTKNKITISVPNGTTNVRALIRMLNNDAGNTELWSVDDVQIIADYPTVTPTTGRYYRSRQNGKWESVSTWEVSTSAGGTYNNACDVPTYSNSDSIIIMNTDTVVITAAQTVDQLRVLSGGKLVLSNVALTINDQSNSTDFQVDGTYEDNSVSPNGITFTSGAKWKYTTGATIIKTNSSNVTGYRDSYEGGISTIPTSASWYYRYNGGGNPNTIAVGMFYPTLYFDNTANTSNFSFNSFTMAFGGSTGGFCTVKGDLNIGTTGTGSVTVYNNNLNSSPMLIYGNVNVAASSTLSNQFCPSCGSADGTTAGDGTGFEVKGNVTVNGTLDVNSSTISSKGILTFSGTGTQTVSGTGTMDLWNVELNKPTQTIVDFLKDATAVNNLNFNSGGIIRTNGYVFAVSNASTSAAITGHQTPNATGSYSNDKYVIGILKRALNTTGTYVFPVGDAVPVGNPAVGEGYNPVELIPVATPSGNITAKFIAGNPGTITVSRTSFRCGVNSNFLEYTGMTGEGWWNLEGTGQTFTYNIRLHPNTVNVNTKPNDSTSSGYRNNYRALKAPGGTGGGTWPSTAALGGDPCTVGSYYDIPGFAYSGFSDFAPGGGNGNTTALPVKLLYFTGKAIEKYSQLNWSTAIEIDNERFEVERSKDALVFQPIAMVKGVGTTTTQQFYDLQDKSPFSGWNYYRLKQVDFDGHFEYSNTVAVYFDNQEEVSVAVYPNPSKGKINIDVFGTADAVDATLYNMLGQTIRKVEVNTSLSIEDLPSGEYFIKFITGKKVILKQFVKE